MSDGAKETSLQQELPLSDVIKSSHHVSSAENMTDSLCFHPTRQKVPSKAVDQDEVRIERVIDMKVRRAGHLGDVRKRLNFVQSLLSEGASVEEGIQSVGCYERAFRKFIDAHESYLRFEVNEGMINVANESYEKEKENKFLLDVELSTWKSKMKRATKAMSKSDHKSRRSSKTGKSSITSSVREKLRILEEARLRVERWSKSRAWSVS